MQKNIRVSALVVAAMLWLGSAAWAQDLYVVASGGRPVGTKITIVPYTITNSGFYYLTGNLFYSGTGNAIEVDANMVTIDLMGFYLMGAESGNGIYMNGMNNVVVRNGTVWNFNNGIYEASALGQNHRIINVSAIENATNGIILSGVNHLVKDCTAMGNYTAGIVVGSGIIAGCVSSVGTIGTSTLGIQLNGPGSVLGCTACGNSSHNFYLGTGTGTNILVDGNSASGLSPNYYNNANPTSGVVITANNAGTP